MYLYYSWVFMLFTQISLLFTPPSFQKQACYTEDHPRAAGAYRTRRDEKEIKHIIYASCMEPRWGVEVSRDDPEQRFWCRCLYVSVAVPQISANIHTCAVCGTVCLLAAGPAAISQGEKRKRRRWYLKVRTGNVKLVCKASFLRLLRRCAAEVMLSHSGKHPAVQTEVY